MSKKITKIFGSKEYGYHCSFFNDELEIYFQSHYYKQLVVKIVNGTVIESEYSSKTLNMNRFGAFEFMAEHVDTSANTIMVENSQGKRYKFVDCKGTVDTNGRFNTIYSRPFSCENEKGNKVKLSDIRFVDGDKFQAPSNDQFKNWTSTGASPIVDFFNQPIMPGMTVYGPKGAGMCAGVVKYIGRYSNDKYYLYVDIEYGNGVKKYKLDRERAEKYIAIDDDEFLLLKKLYK